ncbi:kelch-like protein 1 isoform X2 [Episyrphus balteatus]|uniref:kelch-like protein 1 isoform X2 n=1 Tax=Episyrphus balteatus TaxID=286459 RepID=UPI0024856C5E|nr:kelch-like protein 1 isoform X2 [Episyrphus balteatus]
MASINQMPKVDEKIIFKCDKHSTIISEKLQSFYQEDEFFDTVLIAGSDCAKLQAHRVVLCALTDGCCELIENNIDYSNCLYWFRLAKELSLKSLKAKSLECTYINFEDISKEEEIMTLNENELKDLLFNDNPHGDFEIEVFLSMVKWINYDKVNREHLVFELLSMVRYWVLTPKFIVENRHSVCKTVESYELVCSWLQWHLSPETRTKDHANICLKPRIRPHKLAVVRSYYEDDDRKINIETFDSRKNAWSIEIENCLANKKSSFANIVIDDKLIVVGGLKGFEFQRSVECLDLKTFKWTDFPPMPRMRIYRCELVDLKEYLCAFGRHSFGMTNSISIDLYNFSTRTWREIEPPYCNLNEQNKLVGQNGMLYIFDFKNAYLQIYNAALNQWTYKRIKVDSLKDYGLAAVEGFVYVFGGHHTDNGGYVKNVQRYNLSNNSWCEMAPLPFLQATTVIKTKVFENKIIVSDSLNIAEYNIETDKWNTLNPISNSAWSGTFDIFDYNPNT